MAPPSPGARDEGQAALVAKTGSVHTFSSGGYPY